MPSAVFIHDCIRIQWHYAFSSSPQVGFLRFLHLLSSFDWKNNPLIVNLNGKLTGKLHFVFHHRFHLLSFTKDDDLSACYFLRYINTVFDMFSLQKDSVQWFMLCIKKGDVPHASGIPLATVWFISGWLMNSDLVRFRCRVGTSSTSCFWREDL